MLPERQSFSLPLAANAGGHTHVRLGVFHHKGGTNLYSGAREPAGVFLSVQPVTVKDGMESFVMFSGVKYLLESAARMNRKRIDQLGQQVKTDMHVRAGRCYDLVAGFLAEKGLALAPQAGESAA